MKFYYAPMESITGYPLRNTQHALFGGLDKYFTPFVSANESGRFTGREGRDLAPENNTGLSIVPQILTRNPEHFLWAAESMTGLGYQEINFNLGCPSGTVVAKGKGSGFLRDVDELDEFFETLFSSFDKAGLHLQLSVKTRIGVASPAEAPEILKVYNRYPISELTVHPRLQKDMYRNVCNWEVFRMFYEESKAPVCYNGDIRCPADYQRLLHEFPDLSAVMLGRGLVRNPALARQLRGGAALQLSELKAYVQLLLEKYQAEIQGERNVLFKLKENWNYLGELFPTDERFRKELRKSKNLMEYKIAVRSLLNSGSFAGTEDKGEGGQAAEGAGAC